ncbi:hypothetical protein [Parabacteroides sp.]
MKKILLMITLFTVACVAQAQDMLVATLDGPAGSKVFYGADAFGNAVDEAVSGDRITLSAGTFNAPKINKSLKIQGAGILSDPKNGLYRTSINGGLWVELPEGETDDFLLEGVYLDDIFSVESSSVVKSFTLKKCRFANVGFGSYVTTNNTRIEHCRIKGVLSVGGQASNFTVLNSVIGGVAANGANGTVSYINTIIEDAHADASARFENCILYGSHGDGIRGPVWNVPIGASNVIDHSVSFTNNMFDYIKTQINPWYSSEADVFTEEIGGYSDTALYELTETAKETFVDEGGDQIGIYGGYKPYSATPSNPQIVKRDVPLKSSDGKLKVNITVGSPVQTCEYWFDTDSENKKVEGCASTFVQDLDISSLSEGVHFLVIRFQDALGQWSSPLVHRFYTSYVPTGIEVVDTVSLDGDSFRIPVGAKKGFLRLCTMNGQQMTVYPLLDLSAGAKDLRPYFRDLSAGIYIQRIEILTEQGWNIVNKKLWVK